MDQLRMMGSLLMVERQMDKRLGVSVELSTGAIEAVHAVPTGFCTLIAAGPEVEDLKPGALLVMDKNGGTEVRFNDRPLVVFRHDQVLAVVDGG